MAVGFNEDLDMSPDLALGRRAGIDGCDRDDPRGTGDDVSDEEESDKAVWLSRPCSIVDKDPGMVLKGAAEAPLRGDACCGILTRLRLL